MRTNCSPICSNPSRCRCPTRPSRPSPGPNLLLAGIGFPAPGDPDRILADPVALAELTALWHRNPPDAELLGRAGASPDLARLLAATGFAASVRVGARRRPHYSLAAADGSATRHVQELPGGRLIREPLSDGSVVVTVEIDAPSASGSAEPTALPWVVRLTAAGTDAEVAVGLHLLLLLEAAASRPGRTVGQAVVNHPDVLGAIDISAPFSTTTLDDADLAAVPDSVGVARGDWNLAWRRAARAAGEASPLYDAVLRGARRPS